jgi:hypothetical protein
VCPRDAYLSNVKVVLLDPELLWGYRPCCIKCGSDKCKLDGHMKDARRVASVEGYLFIYARQYRCLNCPGSPGTFMLAL